MGWNHLFIPKLLRCNCWSLKMNEWFHPTLCWACGCLPILGLKLIHPLHIIDNRSRNRRRNLWVGWCVSSWWPLFPSRNSMLIYIYKFIFIFILYIVCIYICIAYLSFLWFTNCFMVSDDNSLIPGCLWLLTFVLKKYFDTRYLVFYNPSPPRMFCPWTFFQNIGFNMVPSDP